MAGETFSAIVLPVEACSSGEPQVVADFPGRWIPGVPYLPEALGLSEDEARRLLRAVDTPLRWVSVTETDGVFAAANEFRRPAGSHAASAPARVELDREAGARRSADPVLDDTGAPVHPGQLGPPKVNVPSWVEQERERATTLAKGKVVLDAGRRQAISDFEERVDKAKKTELLDLAQEMGLWHTNETWKVDEVREEVRDAFRHSLERPDTPFASSRVEVGEAPADPSDPPQPGTSSGGAAQLPPEEGDEG